MQITKDPISEYFWRLVQTSVRKGPDFHTPTMPGWPNAPPTYLHTPPSPSLLQGPDPGPGLQVSPCFCISSKGLSLVDPDQQKQPHHSFAPSSCFVLSLDDKDCQEKKDRVHSPRETQADDSRTQAGLRFSSSGLGFLNYRLYLIYLMELK